MIKKTKQLCAVQSGLMAFYYPCRFPKKDRCFLYFRKFLFPLLAHDYVSRLGAHESLISNIALFRRIYWDKFRVIVIQINTRAPGRQAGRQAGRLSFSITDSKHLRVAYSIVMHNLHE